MEVFLKSGLEALEKGEFDIAKSKIEEALKNFPEFYQRKQVEALIKKAIEEVNDPSMR